MKELQNTKSFLTFTALCTAALLYYGSKTLYTSRRQNRVDRRELPKDLTEWRAIEQADYAYRKYWSALVPILKSNCLKLWTWRSMILIREEGLPPCDNFLFVSRSPVDTRYAVKLRRFQAQNGVTTIVTNDKGRDFVLRVIVAGNQGGKHLQLMRRLSYSQDILFCDNHILPLLEEISYEDITIGVFPKLSSSFRDAFDADTENSVEDVLHMTRQVFEAISYIHKNLIAHRDIFSDNFLVEWFPGSMGQRLSTVRPRVYLIDFETAVEFSVSSLPSERLCIGVPYSESLPQEENRRIMAPELKAGTPYCPFKLDVWQIGRDLQKYFSTGLLKVDDLWCQLVCFQPENRPTADEALSQLDAFLRDICPSDLYMSLSEPRDDVL